MLKKKKKLPVANGNNDYESSEREPKQFNCRALKKQNNELKDAKMLRRAESNWW